MHYWENLFLVPICEGVPLITTYNIGKFQTWPRLDRFNQTFLSVGLMLFSEDLTYKPNYFDLFFFY